MRPAEFEPAIPASERPLGSARLFFCEPKFEGKLYHNPESDFLYQVCYTTFFLSLKQTMDGVDRQYFCKYVDSRHKTEWRHGPIVLPPLC